MHVLQACALLGNNATIGRLERVLEYPKCELLDSLDALDAQSLLVSGDQRVASKHSLMSEASVAKLTKTGSRYLHRRIAIVLESDLEPSSSDPMLWDCANHYQQAGEIDRAVALVSRRADYALQTGALQEAVNMWDRASSLQPPHGGLVSVIQGRLIASLRAASMWTRILRTAAVSDILPPTGPAAPRVHDDAELAVLEAQWQTCQATTPLLQQVMACLRDSTASPARSR